MGRGDVLMAANNNDQCSKPNENNFAPQPCTTFFDLPPTQFTVLSSLLGLLLAQNLDLNQQNSLGNFIESLGQTILAFAAQGQLLQSNNQNGNDYDNEIQALKDQIKALEARLSSIEDT